MELELKHLAPYLPYGLKFMVNLVNHFDVNNEKVDDLEGLFFGDNCITFTKSPDFYLEDPQDNDSAIKPILYPLDYLTKEITHNGETFVPIERLGSLFNMNIVKYCFLEQNYMLLETIVNQRWCIVEKLLEWRFDIHNLIDKGLAIPVTSDFNPYK